jgi:hypothetical protein
MTQSDRQIHEKDRCSTAEARRGTEQLSPSAGAKHQTAITRNEECARLIRA